MNHEQQANFTEFYFSFWPSLISLLVPQVAYSVSRFTVLFQEVDDDFTLLVVDSVAGFLRLLVLCILTHIVVAWIGQTMCDSVVEKASNEEVFDNLEEGLIILDGSSKKILFYNREATQVMCENQDSIVAVNGATNQTACNAPDIKKKMFALVEQRYLTSSFEHGHTLNGTDDMDGALNMIQNMRRLNDYKSLEEVLGHWESVY